MSTTKSTDTADKHSLKFEHIHIGNNDPDYDQIPEFTFWDALVNPEKRVNFRLPETSVLGKAFAKTSARNPSGNGFHPNVGRQHLAAIALNGRVPQKKVTFDVERCTDSFSPRIGHETKHVLWNKSGGAGLGVYRGNAQNATKTNKERAEDYPEGESQLFGSVPSLFIMLNPSHTRFGMGTLVALAIGPLASTKHSQLREFKDINPVTVWHDLFRRSEPDPQRLKDDYLREVLNTVNFTPQPSVEQMSRFLRTIGLNGIPRPDLGNSEAKTNSEGGPLVQQVVTDNWTRVIKEHGLVILTGGTPVEVEDLLTGLSTPLHSKSSPKACEICSMWLPVSASNTTCDYCL